MGVRRELDRPVDAGYVARALSGEPAWFWLDGSGGEPGGRRSYLGVADEVRTARRGHEREFLDGLRAEEPGGWVLALGYEFGVALIGADAAADAAPPGFALRAGTVLVLDEDRGSAELRGPDEATLDAWLARYGSRLHGRARHAPADRTGDERPDADAGTAWRRSAVEYEAEVAACRSAIAEGDAYVLCLTDTAVTSVSPDTDPLRLYGTVRGAARGGVIVAGERALVSASPERFLGVRGDRVATHPIKGTRPRGATPEADEALAAELAADPKERAENLMIVDLMRNDLSRVCEPGSVGVTGFLRVETHPHVHQLVSTIEGRLRSGMDPLDALVACFPGGSMTGAPKRSAVEILGRIEAAPRGLYSGCFGWLGPGPGSGAGERAELELAMTIRSIELRGLGTDSVEARVGAGGGITVDSDPAREHREKLLKAEPLLDAIARSASAGRSSAAWRRR